MDQATVLIVADDAEFSRMVVSRWQTERTIPAFTLVSSDIWQGAGLSDTHDSGACERNSGSYELAIVGPMADSKLASVLQILEPTIQQRPVICICKETSLLHELREGFPRVLAFRQHEGWLDALMLVAGEALRRVDAVMRALQAEEVARAQARNATLGRYMLEMRHSMNNALTSVLGNAELLLLEPGTLSTEVRDQVDTIHSMALRIHEILQRFSSLDAEMNFTEKRSQSETHARSHRMATGS